MPANTATGQKPQIAIARGESEKFDIYRFRYRIFVEEMHNEPAGADREKKMLREPLDDGGIHLYMTVDSKVVGAIRLNLVKLTPVPDNLRQAYLLDRFSSFPKEQISLSSQIVVSEKWRATSVPAVLLGATYKLARRQGVRFDFCHCSASLVALYEQLGYRRYKDNFVDDVAGYAVPLVLLTEDIEYLRDSGSPFFKLASQYPANNKTALWFKNEFSDFVAAAPRKAVTEEDFWRLLTQKLHQIPLISIPLLKDLSYEEAKKFLSVGTVLHVKTGDVIVREGDVGNEMFVLLSGAVEVRSADTDGKEHVLVTLGQGDVFGELAFLSASPRSASVAALADTEVLILTQGFFAKAMEAMPAVTARVLFNLSLILCERLKNATESWMAALGKAAAEQPAKPEGGQASPNGEAPPDGEVSPDDGAPPGGQDAEAGGAETPAEA